MSAGPSYLLRALVRGLEIDAQCGVVGVVNLAVRAEQQHKGIWRRLRQHVAHALFRAGDLCNPGHQHRALRVVELHVPATALDDQVANIADPDVREVWPLHDALGQAHYQALLIHEGVKRHHDGRPAADQGGFFSRQRAADDSHVLTPIRLAGLDGRPVEVWHDPAGPAA